MVKSMSIRTKLLLVGILPLLAFLYYLLDSLGNELQNQNEITEVTVIIDQNIAASALIEQIQIERALSQSLFHGLSSRDAFNQQTRLVDQELETFRQVVQNIDSEHIDFNTFDQLSIVRRQVLNRAEAEITNAVYINLTDELLKFSLLSTLTVTDSDLRPMLEEYQRVFSTREYLSRVRGFFCCGVVITRQSHRASIPVWPDHGSIQRWSTGT